MVFVSLCCPGESWSHRHHPGINICYRRYHANSYRSSHNNKKKTKNNLSTSPANTSFRFLARKWASSTRNARGNGPCSGHLLSWTCGSFCFMAACCWQMAITDLYDKLNVNIFYLLLGHQQDQADGCCKIWLETAACNCSHPQQPSVFLKKTWRRSFCSGFRAVLPSWDPVSTRQFSRWRLRNPHFLGSPSGAFISLSQMPWRRDLAHSWKIPPFSFFKNGHCVLLQVLKDRSPLLSWLCFFLSHPSPPSPSTPPSCKQPHPYPIKCHHTRWRVRGSGCIRLPIKHSELNRGVTENYWLQSLCFTLCRLPSVVCIFHRSSKHLEVNNKLLSYFERAAVAAEKAQKLSMNTQKCSCKSLTGRIFCY